MLASEEVTQNTQPMCDRPHAQAGLHTLRLFVEFYLVISGSNLDNIYFGTWPNIAAEYLE